MSNSKERGVERVHPKSNGHGQLLPITDILCCIQSSVIESAFHQVIISSEDVFLRYCLPDTVPGTPF